MNDIEQKAIDLLNEVRERLKRPPLGFKPAGASFTALCRAIERHEAFRQEVSDAVVAYRLPETRARGFEKLKSFIIPKPDPLVAVLGDLEWNNNSPECAAELRAALEARGLEIKEKGQ